MTRRAYSEIKLGFTAVYSVMAPAVSIERFHSRGLEPCKFIETKGSVYKRKEFNSHRIGLVHQHGRHFIALEHQYGCRDVMCKRSIPRPQSPLI